MSRLPHVDIIKAELNEVMAKYDFSIYDFSVMQEGDNVGVFVSFIANEVKTDKVYRNESCPKAGACIDYIGFHCAGCNGE